MLRSSKAHLAEVGETYVEHMRFALVVGTLGVGAGLACGLHAIVPGLCQHTCSRTLASMQALLLDRTSVGQVAAESCTLIVVVVLLASLCLAAIALALLPR